MSEETNQKTISSCKVTYFIGKMLAKAGMLNLTEDTLLFVPTTLDRALGAIDIPIPISEIEGFYYNDTLQRSLQIKTPSRIHRFIGSSLNEIHENLIVLKRKSSQPLNETTSAAQAPSITEQPKSSIACFNCSKSIKSSFKFCPYCRSQLKLICSNCKEVIEQDWLSCPFCNSGLKKAE